MKRYEGRREGDEVIVTVNGIPLDPRLDLYSHSPNGFEWGYGGSGPAQLALAILADYLGDDDEALRLYQSFKFAVVAGFPEHGWTLSGLDIDQALDFIRKENAANGGVP